MVSLEKFKKKSASYLEMLEEETAKQHEEQGNLTLNVRLRLNAAIKITGRVRYSVTLRDKTEIPLVLAAQPSIHV